MRRALLQIAAVLVSALLYSASFPPLEWSWLMPVALALLFLALRGMPSAHALLAGFAHGFVAYGLGASWFWQIFGAVALALFAILASFHALFAVLMAWYSRRLGGAPFNVRWALFGAALWTFLEFTRGELFWLKFPWFGVGVARGPHVLLPWTGVYGVTFVAVLGVMLLLAPGRSRWLGVAVLGVVAWPQPPPEPIPQRGLEVAAVQAESAPLSTYLNLSKTVPAGTQVLVWPEYAYPSDLTYNPRDWDSIQRFLRERPGTVLVLGTQTWVGEEGWRNTALTLEADHVLGRHFKNHTVHLFDDGIPGVEAVPVATRHGPVGTPICFDCDFQDVIRRMTAAGASFLVAPTMDAESWTARQHEQHARLFQIRAAENRRWIVVAATSGVTQIIDPHGHVTTRLPVMQEGVLSGRVETRQDLTFFVRGGHLFPWILPVFLVVTLLTGQQNRRSEYPEEPLCP